MLATQGASAGKGMKTLRNTPLPWEENQNDSERIRNPSVGPRASFRIRAKGDKEDVSVQQLRTTLSNSLVNMGLLSAFLCALANAIYVSPPLDPKCHGESAVVAIHVIEWCAMGGFFLVIVITVILATDMEGVPDDFLVEHLMSNQMLYTSFHPIAHMAIMFLAVGYGMDLDERAGCPHFTAGLIAAPCFPLLTFFILKYAQHRRRRSGMMFSGGGKSFPLGKSVFSTWADLLLDHDTTSRPATAEPDT